MDQASEFQFSRMDQLLVYKSLFMYLIGVVQDMMLICNKYKLGDPLFGLYLSCLLVPMLLQSCKSLQWYWLRYNGDLGDGQRQHEERRVTWAVRIVFFFFSPLVRFWDVHHLGLRERRLVMAGCTKAAAEEAYKLYLEAYTTLQVLRFFEVFMGDAPLLTIMTHEYILHNKTLWNITPDNMVCLTTPGLKAIKVFGVVFKLVKMADVLMSYSTKTKKWWHLQNKHKYENIKVMDQKKGRVHLPGKLGLLAMHFFQIGCKTWCYAMLWFLWVQTKLAMPLVVVSRWLLNSLSYVLFLKRRDQVLPSRPMNVVGNALTVMSVGAIYLFTHLTFTDEGQLGSILLFHFLNGAEILATSVIWGKLSNSMNATTTETPGQNQTVVTTQKPECDIKEDGVPTQNLISYTLLAMWCIAMVSQAFYYLTLNPSMPDPVAATKNLCCCVAKPHEDAKRMRGEADGASREMIREDEWEMKEVKATMREIRSNAEIA